MPRLNLTDEEADLILKKRQANLTALVHNDAVRQTMAFVEKYLAQHQVATNVIMEMRETFPTILLKKVKI